jgi:hypothetical protein
MKTTKMDTHNTTCSRHVYLGTDVGTVTDFDGDSLALRTFVQLCSFVFSLFFFLLPRIRSSREW